MRGSRLALVLCPIAATSALPSYADVDCSPLDPRVSISKELEVKANGSAETLYKIAQAGGSISGRAQEQIHACTFRLRNL
jgi:hypothetical protein